MKINSILYRTLSASLIALLCASCGHKKPVIIINHKKSIYGKSATLNSDKYSRFISTNSANSYAKNNDTRSTRQVEIIAGDTLYSISQKYQTPLRDLIEANNLSAPYNLRSGSYLIIPHPTYYKVKTGDTLYSISREWQMNLNDLVTLNKLTPPYIVVAGQMIKVKNSNNDAVDMSAPNKKAIAYNDTSNRKPTIVEKIFSGKNNRFAWPIKGSIISKFGPKSGGLYNDGINIAAKEGSPVKASEDGLAAYVGNELKGYGNLVIIKHSGGWITAYAHLSQSTIKRGDKVSKGQTIGSVGSTGNVSSPQLYFGLRKGRDAVNPENYL